MEGEGEEKERGSTFSLTPAACVSFCRSEPARSTRLRRAVLNIGTPSFLSCSSSKASCPRATHPPLGPHPSLAPHSVPSSLTPVLW